MRNIRGWLAAAAAAGVLTQLLVGALPERQGVVAASVPLVLLSTYAVAGHLRQARGARGRMRAGWIVAAAASALWAAANLMYLLDAAGAVARPEPNPAEVTSLTAVALTPVALLLCTPGRGSPAVRVRRAIDGIVVFAAFFLVAWQLVLRDVLTVVEPRVYPLVLGFPGFELACGAAAVVLLSRSLSRGPNALSFLAVSMLVFTVVNLGYIANLVYGEPAYAGGVGAGYTFASALIALASRSVVPPPDTIESEHGSSRWGLLPYVPVAAAFGTAAVLLARGEVPGPTEVWLLLGTAGLVVLRQLLSARTNQGLLWDLTEQRAMLAHLAYHDALTGLANRTLLARRAADDIAATPPGAATAVILLDLDGFKQVNDGLGHAAGDELLVAAAQRLTAATGDAGTVARLGGDEFVVLLPRVTGGRAAEEVARRILTHLAAPVTVAGASLRIRASAGVALGHGPGADLDALLRDADLALYEAKADGRGRVARHRRRSQAVALEPGDGRRSQAVAPEADGRRSQAVALEADGRRSQAVAPEADGRRSQAVALEAAGRRSQAVALEADGRRSQAVAPEADGRRSQAVALEADGRRSQAVALEADDGRRSQAVGADLDDLQAQGAGDGPGVLLGSEVHHRVAGRR
ncbi:diguanylate cyclase domain-containing protein [Dactylosporangium sp. NPDC000521]|uniref:diguanylate cyclase domain-containing protein n=1 Tax=Dactylosporangium sp. NPDC000521 TaxID=3363975 RepID=UPI0036761DD4